MWSGTLRVVGVMGGVGRHLAAVPASVLVAIGHVESFGQLPERVVRHVGGDVDLASTDESRCLAQTASELTGRGEWPEAAGSQLSGVPTTSNFNLCEIEIVRMQLHSKRKKSQSTRTNDQICIWQLQESRCVKCLRCKF
jgi:hypothetical protein